MRNLYINLLNFNDDKLAGVGYFFKRLISNIDFNEDKWVFFDKIIFITSGNPDPLKLFGIKESEKILIKKLPHSGNFLMRIFYEQLIIPIMMIGKKGVFYAPTPAIPMLSWLNKRLKLISTIHDMIPFRVKNKYGRIRTIYVKWLSILAARCSFKVVTVSLYSKTDIVEISRISPAKVWVIYNFIPELNFQSITSREPYFVTICTIEPGKNIETMIKGFYIFQKEKKNEQYKYYIIGKYGWNSSAILRQIKDLGLEAQVILTGYISDSEKNRLISNCTGMIYLSLYEGFGIPPLEGMYFNKVSIVSNTSSLPEVVGEAGILQDPTDAVSLEANLNLLVSSSDTYSRHIEHQLIKFRSEAQINRFHEVLTS